MSKRYEVRAIGSGHWGVTLAATDDEQTAKRVAEQEAHRHYYGTAVVDLRERTADLGNRIVPLNMAFVEPSTTTTVVSDNTDDIPTAEVRK